MDKEKPSAETPSAPEPTRQMAGRIAIRTCECGSKLVGDTGVRIEYRKCECPWPVMPPAK